MRCAVSVVATNWALVRAVKALIAGNDRETLTIAVGGLKENLQLGKDFSIIRVTSLGYFR